MQCFRISIMQHSSCCLCTCACCASCFCCLGHGWLFRRTIPRCPPFVSLPGRWSSKARLVSMCQLVGAHVSHPHHGKRFNCFHFPPFFRKKGLRGTTSTRGKRVPAMPPRSPIDVVSGPLLPSLFPPLFQTPPARAEDLLRSAPTAPPPFPPHPLDLLRSPP